MTFPAAVPSPRGMTAPSSPGPWTQLPPPMISAPGPPAVLCRKVDGTSIIGDVMLPTFLDLPERRPKPRLSGLTHVLDKGASLVKTESVLTTAAPHIDIWKFGWGTAYLDPALPAKLELLASAAVRACVGGTLLEIAWSQGKALECLAWAHDVGFDCVEVSRGVATMPLADKHELIRAATDRFVVLSEVGSKDPHRSEE